MWKHGDVNAPPLRLDVGTIPEQFMTLAEGEAASTDYP
jgi:hypothetical protein